MIGPYTPREVVEHIIEPVRILGWRSGRRNPIIHAKMLVLGHGCVAGCYGHSDYGSDERLSSGRRQCGGSANWTENYSDHLEVGFVSHDAELIDAATDFVADVIAFSEPFDSDRAGPEPNMLGYEVESDAAMWETSENQRIAHEEWEAEQLEDDEP